MQHPPLPLPLGLLWYYHTTDGFLLLRLDWVSTSSNLLPPPSGFFEGKTDVAFCFFPSPFFLLSLFCCIARGETRTQPSILFLSLRPGYHHSSVLSLLLFPRAVGPPCPKRGGKISKDFFFKGREETWELPTAAEKKGIETVGFFKIPFRQKLCSPPWLPRGDSRAEGKLRQRRAEENILLCPA